MDGCLFAPIREKVVEFSKRPGIYDLSYFYGFPFGDVPFVGPTVNCWAETSELAAATAKEFAGWVWENRARFLIKPVSPVEAVKKALSVLRAQRRVEPAVAVDMQVADEWAMRLARSDEEQARTYGVLADKGTPGPVVIADKSDNIGNGAPGDGTHLLWELIKAGVQQAAISAIRDPETVQRAIAAGVGAVIDVELGGKMSTLSGEPVRGKAYVKSLSDGRYRLQSEINYGAGINVGPAAGLLIEGVDVAVVSGGMQAFDHGQLQMLGFDARDYRVIVLKSANHFRGWWSGVASEIIDCDAPGVASNDLTKLTYRNKIRALYPPGCGRDLSGERLAVVTLGRWDSFANEF